MEGRVFFSDADELLVTEVHEFAKGGYQGTRYRYTWHDGDGTTVFEIKGRHHSHLRLPPVQDKYHFALATQQAWSQYLLARVVPAIRAGKTYTFRHKGRDAISCFKDFLEIHHKGNVQRYYAKDLTEVRVKEGKIALKEVGSNEGWFTSTGVHCFWNADLANAHAFLMLLQHVYGVGLNLPAHR
jgi:hypothetical protein